MIIIGACIVLLGIIVLIIPAKSYIVAIAAFVVIGFGCAPIYPCIIHSTPGNFGAENSGAIIGIQMASAYVGSTFMPPLFGLMSNSLGYEIMPFFLMFFLILMIIMTETTFRTAKNINFSTHRNTHVNELR